MMNHSNRLESNNIVVKTCLNSDIRRFSVPHTAHSVITWHQFCDTVSKLYNIDVSHYRITYKDEEGDNVVIGSKEELIEAFDVARHMKPATLRLTLIPSSVTASTYVPSSSVSFSPASSMTADVCASSTPSCVLTNSLTRTINECAPSPCPIQIQGGETRQPPVLAVEREDVPIVYIAGKPFVPHKVVTKPNYGCTKVSPVVVNHFPASVPRRDEPYCSSEYTTSSDDHPVSTLRALSHLTSSISDSVSSNVILSSDTTLYASTNASASTALNTNAASDATNNSSLEVGHQMSLLAQRLAHQSISEPLEATVHALSRISNDTSKNSSDTSDSIAAMVLDRSVSVHDDVAPLSQKTMDLQANATVGLNRDIDRNVDEVVKSITSIAPSW